MRYQAQRGTNDLIPMPSERPDRAFDSAVWRILENAFQALVHRYGYQEIVTPIFEDTDLFVRSSGDSSEVVSKQMYTFADKGDRSLTLKPEGTAPAMRAVIEHNMIPQGGTLKLWYFTQIFRYERPQKGRYRQGHQLGCEFIGSTSPLADAEIIEIAVRFYESLGMTGVKASLNCIGRESTRAQYGQALLGHVRAFLVDQPEEARAKAEKNPLRLLDSKDPDWIEALQGSPQVLDFLEDDSRRHFDEVQSALARLAIPFEVDPTIVRGLDYYTDTVFEVSSTDLGAQSALCGGGRYDNLLKAMGGPNTPSVGFALGIERCALVLEAQGRLPAAPGFDAYIVCATPEAASACQELATKLRGQGFSVLIDVDGKSLKSQMKAADRSGARVALILGEDELRADSVTVRRLADSSQDLVAVAELAEMLR